jgi:selenide,water dikinase
MLRLNDKASRLAVELGLRSATDVTGFSLLGHAMEMADASGVGMRFFWKAIPFMDGARDYAAAWHFPGGSHDNRAYFGPRVTFRVALEEHEQMLLFDAQTSSGLLLCVPQDRRDAFLERARAIDLPPWVIGEIIARAGIEVV